MMNEPYKNISIFEGIRQYFDNQGQEWRQVSNGLQYDFYLKDDDTFILKGNGSPKYRNASIYKAHEHFIYGIFNYDE